MKNKEEKKMQKFIVFAALAAVALAGCRVIEVENHGEEIVRSAAGEPLVDKDGKVQTVKRGWEVYHNQHWMLTEADSITATVKPDDIQFALNGLNSRPDGTNLVALVGTSFDGATSLAAKIIAACVTSGGSTAADAAGRLASSLVAKFTAAGGKAETATVSCANGECTISDGTVTAVGNCSDGSCSLK